MDIEEKTLNSKIKFSYLGLDENSTLVFQVGFECEGSRTYVTNKIPFNSVKIETLLNALELRSWEELPRKFARIRTQGNRIVAIGNVIEDRWFNI